MQQEQEKQQKEVAAFTSCRQLFGVDYFGGVLLSCTQLHTSAHHGKGAPVREGDKSRCGALVGARVQFQQYSSGSLERRGGRGRPGSQADLSWKGSLSRISYTPLQHTSMML